MGGRGDEGDEDEGKWWMDFIYSYEIDKPLAIALSGVGRGEGGELMGAV
jgi:hypothetical protein